MRTGQKLEYQIREGAQKGVIAIRGQLTRNEVPELFALLQTRESTDTFLDLSQVLEMDSAAVACLVRHWKQCNTQGGHIKIIEMSDIAKRSLGMFRLSPNNANAPSKQGFFEKLGQTMYEARDFLHEILQLAADTTFSLFGAVFKRRIRFAPIAEQCVYMGSQAVPIVCLICFILGLTLALQSAAQLQQFGASIYVADLTAIAMVREMGPLMTAILIAGRSGSSIAAEIATMKVSEELDALSVMGLDPIDFLAVPRLLAMCLMMPLLTVFADLAGIIGGGVVGVSFFDIPFMAYVHETIESISAGALSSGIVKSVTYGWGIGLIGLFYGFRVHGGAGEVGRVTTSSVVTSIFYIVITGCLFSILFYMIL